MNGMKRLVVVGAGAMGSFYAGKFFEMDPGCIALLAGGKRGERLRQEGLWLNEKPYPVPVIDPGDKGPPADLVLVAVKNHHMSQALRDMSNLIGDDTNFLSVMNGVDSEEQIAAVYGKDRVLYAVAVGIDAVREGNRTTYTTQGKLFFGEAENRELSPRVRALQALFDRAGIAYETPEDMIRTLWWKFMINVGINQLSAVLRAPYGVFQQSPPARELMETAMREVISVAKAAGVDLKEQDIEDWYSVLSSLSPKGKTSMLQDVESGRKTEVEMFAGRVMELGELYGVNTPLNRIVFKLIKALEDMPGDPGHPVD